MTMKKIAWGLSVLALCLCVNGCKKTADTQPQGNENTEAKVVQASDIKMNQDTWVKEEQKVDEISLLAEIVNLAKEEGDSWTVEDWKKHFRTIAKAMKPLMVELDAISDMAKKSPSHEDEMEKRAKMIEKKYPGYIEVWEDFEEIAKETENGKIVFDDEEWVKSTMDELGIPDVQTIL